MIRWCLRAAIALVLAAVPAVASAQIVADMGVSMVDTPDPVTSGGQLVYSVTVTNNGPDPAANVQVTLPVPASTTFVSLTTPSGWTPSGSPGGPIQWSHALLPVGTTNLSLTVTVSPAFAPGPLPNAVSVTTTSSDPNGGNDTANVSTVVVAPTPIHDIQGPGNSSPIVGSIVTIRAVVTGVASNGFFVQEEDAEVDADPATSEGIFVFTSSAPPAEASIGSLVQLSGTVAEFVPSSDPQQPPRTELTSPSTVLQLSTGNPLPTATPLTPTFPHPAGPFDQLERLEHMRVSAASITVTGPGGTINEVAATGSTDGRFYGAITGVARPFREAGVQAPDTVPSGSIPPIPRWDSNPERLRIESLALTRPFVQTLTQKSSDVVGPIVGVLDYSARAFAILLDGTVPANVTPGTLPMIVTPPTNRDVTVASFNLRRFFDATDDPSTSDAVLTTTAYNNRLAKASIAIRTHLLAPDIIAVQDVETLTVLQDLAAKIVTDGGPAYEASLVDGNDPTGLDVGLLVKTELVGGVPRVSVLSVTQIGQATTWTDPRDNSTPLLNDRPPLVLEAIVNSPDADGFPIVVVATQLVSSSGINDESVDGLTTVGDYVRRKRQAQAEFLANTVQERLTASPAEHLVVTGDFNAFQFNDGYVDGMNVIAGTPSPDNETVVPGDGVDLVESDLINLVNTPAAAERYSQVAEGNAGNLDHVLVSAGLVGATTARRIEHARIGADYPETERNDTASALRLSDRDPVVAYLRTIGPSPDIAVVITESQELALEDQNVTYTFDVVKSGADDATSVTLTDTLPGTMTFVSFDSAAGWSCTTPGVGTGGTVDCSIASLGPGTNTFTLTAHIPPSTPLGTTFTNSVTVASPDDLTEENNTASTTTTVNDVPTIGDLSDDTIPEDSAGSFEPFTFQDFIPGTVTISATSSNQALVPDGHITIQQPGSFFDRAVVAVPAANQHGATVITVTVDDGGETVSDTFTLTVAPVNDAPTIGAIPNQSIQANTVAGPVPFIVADIDDAAADLIVSATSSNQALVADSGIAFSGSGANRAVTITPLADAQGQTTITVTVSDGEASTPTEFVVEVTEAANQAPTLDGVVDVTMQESGTQTLALTVGDDSTPVANLVVSATSSNTTLLPNASITLGGADASRTLTLSPAAEQSGQTTVTVTVSDGTLTTTRTSLVTVAAATVPAPPTDLEMSVTGTTVTLTWHEPTTGATPTFYAIEGGSTPSLTTLPVIDTSSRVVTWTQNLPAGIYFLRVRSANRLGTSVPSNEVRAIVTSPVAIAGPPTGFAVEIASTRATVEWNRPASGSSAVWQIELGSSAGASDRGLVQLPPQFTTASGLLPAGDYFARVRGLNAAGAGPASNEVRFHAGDLPPCAPLGAPVLLPATVRDRVVTLGWHQPANIPVTTYRLLVGTTAGAANLAIADLPAATAFVTAAPPGVYHVTVLATNACGVSAPSNSIVVTVAAIDPPADVRAGVGGRQVAVAWRAVTGASSYVLEAGLAPGLTSASVPVTGTAIVFNDVPPGTYYARIRAVGAAGEISAPSAEIVVIVQ